MTRKILRLKVAKTLSVIGARRNRKKDTALNA